MQTTKFTIEDYLAEYLRGKWGVRDKEGRITNVVEIPENVYLYHTISSLTQKKPRNVNKIEGNIEIVIPYRREGNKHPEIYNYISEEGARIFNSRVKRFFRADMHEFLDMKKHIEGISYKEAAFEFLGQYGIESFDSESVTKNYKRWREKIRTVKKKPYSSR